MAVLPFDRREISRFSAATNTEQPRRQQNPTRRFRYDTRPNLEVLTRDLSDIWPIGCRQIVNALRAPKTQYAFEAASENCTIRLAANSTSRNQSGTSERQQGQGSWFRDMRVSDLNGAEYRCARISTVP